MSNAFVFASCFDHAKEILATPQMDVKKLEALLLHLDGKSAEEVKQIVKDLVEKEGESLTKMVDGVLDSTVALETRVVEEVEEVKRVVDVVVKSGWWCCK